jgi:hypothetical protein
MEFKTEAQRVAYERCAALATKVFGEAIIALDEEPCFVMSQGSTLVYAHVKPWGDDGSILQVYAPVVLGAEMTQELALYLLRENDGLRFGGFSVGEDDAVFFNYNVIADAIGKEVFKSAILTVLAAADDYDDELVARWGGRRVSDTSEES